MVGFERILADNTKQRNVVIYLFLKDFLRIIGLTRTQNLALPKGQVGSSNPKTLTVNTEQDSKYIDHLEFSKINKYEKKLKIELSTDTQKASLMKALITKDEVTIRKLINPVLSQLPNVTEDDLLKYIGYLTMPDVEKGIPNKLIKSLFHAL